eukprot:10820038-Ditylum_brightwellii.AAC.1
MDGKDISPDVLRTISNAASDMIRDINCCCEMETLGQFFPNPHHLTRIDLLNRIRMIVNRTRSQRSPMTASPRRLRKMKRQKRKDG